MRALPLSIGTIHFVGIGGIGMSGIAEILHNLGYAVQGSDLVDGANVQRLQQLGIAVEIGHKADAHRLPGRRSSPPQAAQRRPCRLQDLDGADHADRILQVDSRVRIQRQKLLSKLRNLELREITSQVFVGWHAGKAEAIAQRIDVEHRAAFDDGNEPAPRDVVDGGASTLDILGRVERRAGIDEINHVVTDLPPLLVARLVGGDVQPFVDLARVGDHDLATDRHRQVEGEC